MNVPETVFSHEWLLFLSVCESTFFEKILDVLTMMGGGMSDVR